MTESSSTIPSVFQFNGTTVQTVLDEQGEPWFSANEVCGILGYTNPRKAVADHCRDPGVTKRDIGVVTGKKADGTDALQTIEATFINEGNLYRLMVKSRKPEAERFESWVMEEVLPTLRKTGRYAVPVEATITPAQQRQLLNAIAARFPDGKKRPYAWSRFGNHFGLGSYKQLPATKVDEALAYIAQMAGGEDATERERLARDLLGLARFILSVDHQGRMQLKEIPHDAYVLPVNQWPDVIANEPMADDDLLNMLTAVADRLSPRVRKQAAERKALSA